MLGRTSLPDFVWPPLRVCERPVAEQLSGTHEFYFVVAKVALGTRGLGAMLDMHSICQVAFKVAVSRHGEASLSGFGDRRHWRAKLERRKLV